MALLAQELVRQGHRVALVVNPVPDPIERNDSRLTIVEREARASGRLGGAGEIMRVLRALVAANGRVIVVRTGNPVVGFIALCCLAWRRRFVFSSASNFDFLDREHASRMQMAIYRFGVRRAGAVVVQSTEQADLAKQAFPQLRRVVHIPSFAEGPSETTAPQRPDAFIWAGRLVDYKRPLLFADLAEAVPEARFVLIPHLPQDPAAEELLATLKDFAARLENLEIGSELPHAELVEKLSHAVALVNTSPVEGMPNTFLEAWAQGVPVLTFSFDPDGVIQARDLGIAADGSWERFVDGARQLWAERLDRGATSERVRAYLCETHSLQAVGAKWEELLRSVGAFDSHKDTASS